MWNRRGSIRGFVPWLFACVLAPAARAQCLEWSPGFSRSGLWGPGASDRAFASASAVFDDGSGPALFVGGQFGAAGGIAAGSIARWDGVSWSSLAGGFSEPGSFYVDVDALAVFDDGTGPALYAAGVFNRAGGVVANSIAKWDGASWSSLSSGIDGIVYALAVFDDGPGA